MNWKYKDKIIKAICEGSKLYVKDTGVCVDVEYYGTEAISRYSVAQKREDFCQVKVINTPTKKALNLFKDYHIKKSSFDNKIEINGTIELKNLSLVPFESKAARTLYGKK